MNDKTVKIFGTEIPRYAECPWCHKKNACQFRTWTYDTPCDKCKATKKYQDKIDNHVPVKDHIGEAFKSQRPTAVFTKMGRNLFVNHKGDIIKDESWRPLKAGK